MNEDDIRRLYVHLGQAMRDRWQRDLPFGELVSDRWERARRLGFGEGASVYESSYIYGKVTVGAGTWIGPFTLLDGSGGLAIGSTCSISAGVHVYTHDSVRWALSGGSAEYEHAAVRIGDCCFVGPQTVIVSGVTIGDHSLIGANSFVDTDVPPFTIALGTPALPVGRVEISDGGIRLVFDK